MKVKLLNQINQNLKSYSKGTFKHRQTKRQILIAIVKDLLDLKIAPSHFSHMTEDHIIKLCEYWKSKGISQATITNKLGAFRTFVKHAQLNIGIPTNAQLNIIKKRAYQATYIPEDLVHQVDSKITAIILKLQLNFGLTKLEAIRLPTRSISKSELCIPSKIAYNRKLRAITLFKHSQREIIHDFLKIVKEAHSLADMATEKHIIQLYNAELALLKVNYNSNFRKIYGNQRLAILMKKGLSKDDAYEVVMIEMGYSSKDKLIEAIA